MDEKYLTEAKQDPHEPKWASDATIAEMQQQAKDPMADIYPGTGNVPTVRTSSGALDFMHDVVDEVENFLGIQEPKNPPKPKLDVISTRELAADKWRGRKQVITADSRNPLLTRSDQRRSALLINYGPNLVWVSSSPNTNPLAPNSISLPINTATFFVAIPIDTKDDVWAICATGETGTVHVIEVFDMES